MNWLIYLLVGIIFIFTAYRTWKLLDISRRRSSSQIWTPTTGKVIERRIKNAGRGMYYPEITYTYSVLGTEYRNKFSLGISMLGKAKSKLEELGDEIGLRYDPQNPRTGIADQEKIGGWDIYLCVVGIIAVLIVLVFGVLRV